MLKPSWHVFCLTAVTMIALGSVASAQEHRAHPRHDREGGWRSLRSDLKVSLTDNPLIVAIVNASLSDIKQGSFIGATGMPQSDGSQKAIEVHIFPNRYAAPAKGTMHGICSRKAP
jgi:hypothetical protein